MTYISDKRDIGLEDWDLIMKDREFGNGLLARYKRKCQTD